MSLERASEPLLGETGASRSQTNPLFADRRTPYRDAHLKLARAAAANGELLLGGAFADPVDGAALAFKAADQPVAKRFAANDAYATAGLVTKWTVRKWTVVVEAVP